MSQASQSRAVAAAVLALSILVGGAVPADAGEAAAPLDAFNAWAHDFNRAFGRTVVSPVLEAGRALPPPLPSALGNAFANLSEPVSAVSQAMMGDLWTATRSSARFTINSTAGLLGIIDVATPIGLPTHKTHFSEGVCALGLPMTDRYLVVPGIGPSSVGVAGAAVVLMVGSTWALAYVSLEMALASVAGDLVASAAALENAAAMTDGPDDPVAEEAAFRAYLARIGC